MGDSEAEAFLKECGVCLVRSRRMLRLPCSQAHLLCQLCLDTIKSKCPFCRSEISAGAAESVPYGGVACQLCGETRAAEDAAFCLHCRQVLCLQCCLFKHDKTHDFRPFQDASLLRSTLAQLRGPSEEEREAFGARMAEVAELLWTADKGVGEDLARGLRDALPGVREDAGMDLPKASALILAARFAQLVGVEVPEGMEASSAQDPSVRKQILEESPESLAARFRSLFLSQADQDKTTDEEPIPEADSQCSSEDVAASDGAGPGPSQKKKAKTAAPPIRPFSEFTGLVRSYGEMFEGWRSAEGRGLVRDLSYPALAAKLRSEDPTFALAVAWLEPEVDCPAGTHSAFHSDKTAAILHSHREDERLLADQQQDEPKKKTFLFTVGGRDRSSDVEKLSLTSTKSKSGSWVFRGALKGELGSDDSPVFGAALPDTDRPGEWLLPVVNLDSAAACPFPLVLRKQDDFQKVKGLLWARLGTASGLSLDGAVLVEAGGSRCVVFFVQPCQALKDLPGGGHSLVFTETPVTGRKQLSEVTLTSTKAGDVKGQRQALSKWSAKLLGPKPPLVRKDACRVYEPTGALIYSIGGWADKWHPLASVERLYFPNDKSIGERWEEVAPLPEALGLAAAAVHLGRVFVTGGVRSDGSASHAVYVLHNEAWHKAPPMNVARMRHSVVSADGRLFAIGGDGDVASRTVEELDVGATKWTLWKKKLRLAAHNSVAVAVSLEASDGDAAEPQAEASPAPSPPPAQPPAPPPPAPTPKGPASKAKAKGSKSPGQTSGAAAQGQGSSRAQAQSQAPRAGGRSSGLSVPEAAEAQRLMESVFGQGSVQIQRVDGAAWERDLAGGRDPFEQLIRRSKRN